MLPRAMVSSCSSLEENDVMAPSAESIIRQILYGTHFFAGNSGSAAGNIFCLIVLVFQLLCLPSGPLWAEGFFYSKLSWGSAVGIPFNLGVWAGPDGQSIIAALNPGDYVSKITGDLTRNETWMNR